MFDNKRTVPLLSQPNRPKLSGNMGNTDAALSTSRSSLIERNREGPYIEGYGSFQCALLVSFWIRFGSVLSLESFIG